jgi:hypothetical protein
MSRKCCNEDHWWAELTHLGGRGAVLLPGHGLLLQQLRLHLLLNEEQLFLSQVHPLQSLQHIDSNYLTRYRTDLRSEKNIPSLSFINFFSPLP